MAIAKKLGTKNGYFSGMYPNGGNTHESQENARAAGCSQAAKVDF